MTGGSAGRQDRTWQYLLVGGIDDRYRALEAALNGRAGFDLVRTVVGTLSAELLRPDGSWFHTDCLVRMRYRGDIAWDVPVTVHDARRVVAAWQQVGRLHAEPDLAEPVPAELSRIARVGECADRLAAAPPLPAEAEQRVRDTLLDEDLQIAASWLAGTDRLAVPVQNAWRFSYPDELAKARAAFETVGATTLWAVSVLNAEERALWGVPRSVEVPDGDDWLGGASLAWVATGDVVLTTPDLDVVVLQRSQYGVVAGSPDFVRTLLGVEPDDAREAFLAYLRGESYRTPTVDLSGVAARYGPARYR